MEFLQLSSGYENSLFSEDSLPRAGNDFPFLSSLATAKVHVGLDITAAKSHHDLADEKLVFESQTALDSFDDAGLPEPDWMTEKVDFGNLDLEALIGAYRLEDSNAAAADEPVAVAQSGNVVVTPATDIEFLHTLVGGEDPTGDPPPEQYLALAQAHAKELMSLTPVSLTSRSPAPPESGGSSPIYVSQGPSQSGASSPISFSESCSPLEELMGREEALIPITSSSPPPPTGMTLGVVVPQGASPTPATLSVKRKLKLEVESAPPPGAKRARRLQDPAATAGLSSKKEKKKNQNKQAATRYRQKKKVEGQTLQEEHSGLEQKNKTLQETVQSLEKEISCLKSIMMDVYKVRKTK